jgi:RNA recognition motif-containing protein
MMVCSGTSADTEMKTEEKEESEEEEELPQPDNDTTLFIKNLNFITTEDSLKTVTIFSDQIVC